jgi:hypothetical protein
MEEKKKIILERGGGGGGRGEGKKEDLFWSFEREEVKARKKPKRNERLRQSEPT